MELRLTLPRGKSLSTNCVPAPSVSHILARAARGAAHGSISSALFANTAATAMSIAPQRGARA